MKITLIKPNIGIREYSGSVDNASMEPLQLGILAALTPPDMDVVMYDDRLEPIPYDEPTDLAAITVEAFTAKRSYEICAEFRKRGVKVLMGGMHMTVSRNIFDANIQRMPAMFTTSFSIALYSGKNHRRAEKAISSIIPEHS